MAQYLVELKGESRELYVVEADSAEEAESNWSTGWLEVSEAYGMDVVSVTKEPEDDEND